jgi:hypothetical protein
MWSVLIAVVSGGLAAAIAWGVVRDVSKKPVLFAAVMAVAFAGFNVGGRALVLPGLKAWQAQRDAAFFNENRIFNLLAERHPEVREQLTALMDDRSRRGISEDEAYAADMAWGRNLVGPYFEDYATEASGDALLDFVRVTVGILEHLEQREDDACYYWMFGGPPPPDFAMASVLSTGVQAEMLDAMADVVESAIQNPQPPPDAGYRQSLMEALVAQLMREHGPDFAASLAMLQEPRAPGVDRKEVCRAATAFYRTALSTPESARLVRVLFNVQA